jgi:hypothetical protein
VTTSTRLTGPATNVVHAFIAGGTRGRAMPRELVVVAETIDE